MNQDTITRPDSVLAISLMRSLYLRQLAASLYRITKMSPHAEFTDLSEFQRAQMQQVARKCWEMFGDELMRITR